MSRDILDLQPEIARMAAALVDWAELNGCPIVLTQTFRSSEDQAAIYRQGRTLPGPVLTHAPAGYSLHEFGLAFDVVFKVHLTDGSTHYGISYEGPWEKLGNAGEQIGLDWGGRWKHADRPHFEFRAGQSLAQIRASGPYLPKQRLA